MTRFCRPVGKRDTEENEVMAFKRIEPCSACLRDPAFGVIHVGCWNCKREEHDGPQKTLIRTTENGRVVYVEKEQAGTATARSGPRGL
jgi:hypothetical protein